MSSVVQPIGLSDDKLLASIQSLRYSGRRLDVQLLILLAEIEERRLHLRLACPSIFDFCRRKLHMSEGESSRRMVASRLLRKLPALIPYIEAGRIHLQTLSMLRDFLTAENVEELVTVTEGKTKDQVKELLAALAPRPDVPARIRKLPDRPPAAAPAVAQPSLPMQAATPERRPARIEPLAPARYKLEMTLGAAERDKLERVRALMRHRLPSGDLTAIFGEALDLLVTKLEKERLGAAAKPRRAIAKAPSAKSRNVPRAVRRDVFARDGEQCTFRDPEGHRCPAREFLELDHISAFGQGGEPTLENLRVRCRPHNKLHAEDCFGAEYVKERIETRQRGSREPSSA